MRLSRDTGELKSMNNISEAFDGKKALIAFITCGDPDFQTTEAVIKEMEWNGADLIELGIPFSDAAAEDAAIREANLRALSAGSSTEKFFAFAARLKKTIRIPRVIMTYANVVFSYGTAQFLDRCSECGISGLVVPDIPFEEKEEFLSDCAVHDVALISMIAPSSGARIPMIAREAEGFLYVISNAGKIGMLNLPDTEAAWMIALARENTGIPCAVELSVSKPTQIPQTARFADGIILDTAIVKLIAQYGKEAPRYAGEFIRLMKETIENTGDVPGRNL